MPFSFADSPLASRVIMALCSMLVHSLWIGVVAACVAAVIVLTTSTCTPIVRYRLFCALLGSFVTAVFAIFFVTISNDATRVGTGLLNGIRLTPPLNLNNISMLAVRINYFLNNNANRVVGGWIVLLVLKNLQTLYWFVDLRRVRSNLIQGITDGWQNKVDDIANCLRVRGHVQIVGSRDIAMPATIGWLKPIIIMPAAALFQMPVDQIETILWHEIAHIARRDYLVNLLQKVVESIFFFNPGLLWISKLIREEREMCCDEIVLANTPNRTTYFNALMAFSGKPLSDSEFAMPLRAGDSDLLSRLKRIVNMQNRKLHGLEKICLVTGVFFCITALLLIGQTDSFLLTRRSDASLLAGEIPHGTFQIQRAWDAIQILGNERVEQREITATDERGISFTAFTRNRELVRMIRNGQTIRGADLDAWRSISNQLQDEADKIRGPVINDQVLPPLPPLHGQRFTTVVKRDDSKLNGGGN